MATRPKERRQTPLIVYCSRTDNTRRVAAAMAKPLAAELVAIDRLKDHQLRGRAVIGLGSGVYWLRLERGIVDLAARIPSNCRVFIFSTSGWARSWDVFYRAELEKRLNLRGIEVIDRWHGLGQDRNPLFKWLGISRGRPDDEDIRRAGEFAQGIKRRF